MEDKQNVQLYWQRQEAAITESRRQYGGMLDGIAYGILQNREDSEECVNDTYLRAWDSMPPQQPRSLGAYLGRITRNLSINRFYKNHAQKRGSGTPMSELSDCVPAPQSVEQQVDAHRLAEVLRAWLSALPPEERGLFLRRYWFAESLDTLAAACGTTPNKLAGRLFRLRRKLRTTLEQEECL